MSTREALVLERTIAAARTALETGEVQYIWEDQGCVFVTAAEPIMDYCVILATVYP